MSVLLHSSKASLTQPAVLMFANTEGSGKTSSFLQFLLANALTIQDHNWHYLISVPAPRFFQSMASPRGSEYRNLQSFFIEAAGETGGPEARVTPERPGVFGVMQ